MAGLLLGVGIAFLSFCSGRQALSFLKPPIEKDEEIVFGTALGLGLLSHAVLVLGLFHCLNPNFLWALILGMFLLSLGHLKSSWTSLKDGFRSWKIKITATEAIVIFLAVVAFGAAVLGVLAPEMETDALCYHLHLPKLFLRSHRVGFFPYEINSLFPFLMEMLYTLGLGISGVALAKFFHLFTGVLGALAILVFARRQVETKFARLSAILYFTTPLVVNQVGTTLIDAGFACFSVLALAATFKWLETKHTSWLILTGIFLGFALSTKYLAAIVAIGIFLLIIWELIFKDRSDAKTVVRSVAILTGAAFLFSAYWYLRAYLKFGNPVYPFFYSIFKSGVMNYNYNDIGVPKNWLSFILVPWTMTMHPERFEGYAVQIGPGYLALLPSVFFALKKNRYARLLLLFSLFYFICWFFLGQSPRFLIPVLPILAVLIAIGLAQKMNVDTAGRVVQWLFLFVLALHAGLALYHYRNSFKVALGFESEDHYLARTERTYEVAKYTNSQLSQDAKIMNADETHLFYFDRPMVREYMYARWTEYDKKVGSPRDIFDKLKKEGFTHILYTEGNQSEPSESMRPFRIPRIIQDEKNSLALYLNLIYTHKFVGKNGSQMNYTLYEIR